MKVNRKIRQNSLRSKNADGALLGSDFMGSLDLVLKFILVILILALFSLGLIFIHDFITQNAYFGVKTIDISGTATLTRSQLISQAKIEPGENVLAINLKTVRNRLVAHPWIRDAVVHRQIPSTLFISVVEEKAIARGVLEDGSQVLLDMDGQPFKPYEPEKEILTSKLPMVSGLGLELLGKTYGLKGRLHHAVMELLSLENIHIINEITADRDLGISISTDFFKARDAVDDHTIMLKLGFEGFKAKFNMIQKIMDYIENSVSEKRLSLIDMFNIKSVTATLEDKVVLPGNTKGGV